MLMALFIARKLKHAKQGRTEKRRGGSMRKGSRHRGAGGWELGGLGVACLTAVGGKGMAQDGTGASGTEEVKGGDRRRVGSERDGGQGGWARGGGLGGDGVAQ